MADRGSEEETLRCRVVLASTTKGLAHMCHGHDCQLGEGPGSCEGSGHDNRVAADRNLRSPTPPRRKQVRLRFRYVEHIDIQNPSSN